MALDPHEGKCDFLPCSVANSDCSMHIAECSASKAEHDGASRVLLS